MAGRIVLFGATGYTGRLTAEALVSRGAKPVLAARNEQRLAALARDLGADVDTAAADVGRPETVRDLVGEGDVLVTTVGPFLQWGEVALRAAIERGAAYLDSTGEPPFIRRVFEEFGPAAEARGCGLVTAFGYDFVPGNLAGGLALRDAGEAATRVDVGYFFSGRLGGGVSGGTLASLAGVMLEPGFAWRGGRLQDERGAARVRSFSVGGRRRSTVSVGSSEHFALPRLRPGLDEVNAYLGWFGGLSRPMQALSAGGSAITRIPRVRGALDAGTRRFVRGSTGGPDAAQRAGSGSQIVGIAYDAGGRELARAELTGPNGYDFTAEILAWGAMTAAERGLRGSGALGPVDAFGLDELEAGCASVGLRRV